jgi:hypothetical protein
MGLINSIGAYFNKFLGGWTFGTQTDQLTVKNSVEIEGTTGTIYEHTFPNKNGTVAHLDDRRIYAYTPTSSADVNGIENDISYDSTFLYIKTASGWRRINLTSF